MFESVLKVDKDSVIMVTVDPITSAHLVGELKETFMPVILDEYPSGYLGRIAGVDFRMSPDPLNHDQHVIRMHEMQKIIDSLPECKK